MPTVRFSIKQNQNPASIYVRLRDGRKVDITLKTNKTINPKFWNKNRIKQSAAFDDKLNLENDLNGLKSLILKRRNDSITDGVTLSKEWLQQVIYEWQGVTVRGDSNDLVSLIQEYIESLPHQIRNGKVGVANGTLRNYKTTISRLIKFQEYSSQNYNLEDIDLGFHKDFIKFLKEQLGLAVNSISKDISNIKAVCRDADERGFKVSKQLYSRNFSAPKEKAMFITLNTSELELISKYEGKNYLENTRDWLIIGCWTGCRVGDLMKLTMDNITVLEDGREIIQYTQRKTGKTVKVPVNKYVNKVLKRLNDFPRPISDQKYNKYLKELCKSVGLNQMVKGSRQNPLTHKREIGAYRKWELVRSHIGRRSFATNHYNLLPNKLIMAVTGHATEAQLLGYIGEVESDHLDSFFDLWSKDKLS